MKFLRADDEIHIRQLVKELLPATLGHATHEAQHHMRPILAHVCGEVFHFVDGLLFRGVADAAGVKENDIGHRRGGRERITFGDELGGDGFGIALVHLASVGFDVHARHNA